MILRLRRIWRDALTLLLALRDRRTPARARLAALAALVYALSPVDLLPEALPLLGVGDDLVVVPTVLAFAARGLPPAVLADARARSTGLQRRLPWLLPSLGLLFLAGLVGLGWALLRTLSG